MLLFCATQKQIRGWKPYLVIKSIVIIHKNPLTLDTNGAFLPHLYCIQSEMYRSQVNYELRTNILKTLSGNEKIIITGAVQNDAAHEILDKKPSYINFCKNIVFIIYHLK